MLAIKVIILLLLFLLLIYLISRLLKMFRKPKAKLQQKTGKSPCSGSELDGGDQEGDTADGGKGETDSKVDGEAQKRAESARLAEEERRKAEELKKQKKVQAIQSKGGLLKSVLDNRSDSITSDKLEALYLAATQNEVRFDLKTERNTEQVNYPTDDMEIVPVDDPSQFPDVLPADMALEDETFYRKFVNGELMRPQYFETTDTAKRMYILWDVSPSMGDQMWLPDGEMGTRDTWARAVIAGLLVDAVEGRAEYFLRPFSEYPYDVISVFNKTEAEKILYWILDSTTRGNNTDIGAAIAAATRDIRQRQNTDTRMNHLLLISDCRDNGGLTKEKLEEMLGEDVKLHVIIIGTSCGSDNPLKPYIIAEY